MAFVAALGLLACLVGACMSGSDDPGAGDDNFTGYGSSGYGYGYGGSSGHWTGYGGSSGYGH